MVKSIYESWFERFLELKPEITREELEKMIKNKKEKIGAGYLTDQGALYLIASDYGIALSSKPPSSERERKPIQKINSYALERKFNNLKSDSIRKERFGIISSILALCTMGSAMYFLIEFSWDFNINLIISGVLSIVFGLATAYLIIQNRKLVQKRKDIIFMKFFQVYHDLQKIHDSQNTKNSSVTQQSIIELVDFLDLWTSNNYAPESISGIPEMLIKNLKNKIIPLVNIQSMSEIKKAEQLFLEFSSSISNSEPKINDLISFNYSLDSFPKITEKELKMEGILTRKPLLKPIFIGVVFWAVFFTILISLNVEIGNAVAFSVTSAIALIAFVRREIGKSQEN